MLSLSEKGEMFEKAVRSSGVIVKINAPLAIRKKYWMNVASVYQAIDWDGKNANVKEYLDGLGLNDNNGS